MVYIAHIRASDGKIQSVEQHLLEVQALAETLGEKLGVRHIAGLAGVLHDMGKFTDEFRAYLLEAVNNPDSPPQRGSVDHSTAGGKLLYELYHTGTPSQYYWMLAEIVGNTIISHHAYLHDYLNEGLESDYLRRVRDKSSIGDFEKTVRLFYENVMDETAFREYVVRAAAELEAFLIKPFLQSNESKAMFLTKFVFSALIDADRTNTRLFEDNQEDEPKADRGQLFVSYYDKLMAHVHALQHHSDAQTSINKLRREMSEQCDRFAERPSDIYTLSIPTGGGKTLASLRYGLKHAICHRKKHVIFIVPYTTIIEQNAEEVRRILQDDVHILEHHSNVVDDADDEDEWEDGRITTLQKLKLAKDNWDSPIIFTTMVQFLDVFYAKGSRNIRRLHNLCDSVIVFDEVQKVPVSCVSLFNHALNFLKDYGQSSLVLCTATQPALAYVEEKLNIPSDSEMIGNLEQVMTAFKRVEIVDRATEGTLNSDALAEFVRDKLAEARSVLVILNTKTVVLKLYQQLNQDDVPVHHLSTSMCAAHRNYILAKVKRHLEREERVVCVCTQLIEAGVDVSFDCVIRSLAGLDSIAQAAGRCNRHGKKGVQDVYVIDHEEENLKDLREIRVGKEIARKMFVDVNLDPDLFEGNLLSDGAMKQYFQEFYTVLEPSLKYIIPKLKVDMMELLISNRESNRFNLEFEDRNEERLPLFIVNSYRTAAEHFQVIEDMTISVIVPFNDESKDIIARLNGDEKIEDLSKILRRAQQYSVNLFRHEIDRLAKGDGLVSLLDAKVLALKESAYSEEIGVDLGNDSGFGFTAF